MLTSVASDVERWRRYEHVDLFAVATTGTCLPVQPWLIGTRCSSDGSSPTVGHIEQTAPTGLDIHVIVKNYGTHTSPKAAFMVVMNAKKYTMKKYIRSALIGASAVSSFPLPVFPLEQNLWHFHADHVLGTSLDVAVAGDDEADAILAVRAVCAEIQRLDSILSNWMQGSELATLNMERSGKVSPELFSVVASCESWRQETNGAFDARLGHIFQAWSAGHGGSAPDAEAIELRLAALADVDIQLEPDTRRIVLPEGVWIAPNGLAKGYIIDAAIAAPLAFGPRLSGLMVDIGGDISCWGCRHDGKPWTIGIADWNRPEDNSEPAAVVEMRGKAIATSGRGMRDIIIDGKPCSHLVSPLTGQPGEHVVSATVVADTAADADALATAFSVLDPAMSLATADRLPGVATRIVLNDGSVATSRRWVASVLQPPVTSLNSAPVLLADADRADAPLGIPLGFGMSIRYEIPYISVGRFRRYREPYMAIWITDGSGELVRTVMLLGRLSGYHRSNYVWWRSQGSAAAVSSISRPTRLPGRYFVAWDGTDDEGRRVKQGAYVLHIEAAREGGGHNYDSIDLELGSQRFERTMPGGGEIGDVTLTYGPQP